jgi:hypothetical protein
MRTREHKYLTYEGFKHDKYINKRLYEVHTLSRDNQYRIHESILFRNEEGLLGFVGEGVTWGLCYATGTGSYCFNPIKETDLLWSAAHNCYFHKAHKEHFTFPIIIGQFYYLVNGVKSLGMFRGNDVVPALPKHYTGTYLHSPYY